MDNGIACLINLLHFCFAAYDHFTFSLSKNNTVTISTTSAATTSYPLFFHNPTDSLYFLSPGWGTTAFLSRLLVLGALASELALRVGLAIVATVALLASRCRSWSGLAHEQSSRLAALARPRHTGDAFALLLAWFACSKRKNFIGKVIVNACWGLFFGFWIRFYSMVNYVFSLEMNFVKKNCLVWSNLIKVLYIFKWREKYLTFHWSIYILILNSFLFAIHLINAIWSQ